MSDEQILHSLKLYAAKLTRDYDEQDDMMQSARIKLWLTGTDESHREYRRITARSAMLDVFRHERRFIHEEWVPYVHEDIPVYDPTIISDCGINAENLLSFMSELDRKIVILKAKGCDSSEISLECGITVSATKSRLSRSQAQMREQFGEYQ